MKRRIVCALALALASSSSVRAEDLAIADLEYEGAFRLPAEFDWGARGMSYRAAGDSGRGSLIVLGHDQRLSEWGEVTIPEPGRGGERSLPGARLLSPMVEFDGSLMEGTVSAEESRGGDLACLPPGGGRAREVCYWNVEWWYNTGAVDYPAVGLSRPDGGDPRGLYHVGPRGDPVFHGARQGAYLFDVPAWFADSALGGRSLMAGMSREAGCCGGSQGPTLFAFRPFDRDDPPALGDLDALALVYYPERSPECAGPNVGDPGSCYFPGYRACDTWVGGAFVQAGDRAAVLLVGVKASGENRYGAGRAGACQRSQGYHCEPLEAQILFYSLDDLTEAAADRREPWRVLPYATWRPPEFLDTPCPMVGGAAADHEGGRLFVIEKGHGTNNSAVVHVYRTAPGGRGSPPPAAPSVSSGASASSTSRGATYRSGCACRASPAAPRSGAAFLAILVIGWLVAPRLRSSINS